MDDYFSQLPAEDRMEADASAEWFVELLSGAAASENRPLSNAQIWILKHPFWEFSEEIREEVLETNNRAVELIRKIVLEQVRNGAECMKVRNGLWVPTELELHYEVLFTTQQNWFISSVLQNAFLGNPLNGEDKVWTPNNKPPQGKSNTQPAKTKTPPPTPNGMSPTYSNKQGGGCGQIVFFGLVGAIILFILIIIISGISNAANSSYNTSTTPTPVDTGAPIPGDYWDEGKFAWQWVSNPTCPTGSSCTQARIFSKFSCPYEVWVSWERYMKGSTTPYDTNKTAIPAMTRGQTAVATLATKSSTYLSSNFSHRISKITCGQTG